MRLGGWVKWEQIEHEDVLASPQDRDLEATPWVFKGCLPQLLPGSLLLCAWLLSVPLACSRWWWPHLDGVVLWALSATLPALAGAALGAGAVMMRYRDDVVRVSTFDWSAWTLMFLTALALSPLGLALFLGVVDNPGVEVAIIGSGLTAASLMVLALVIQFKSTFNYNRIASYTLIPGVSLISSLFALALTEALSWWVGALVEHVVAKAFVVGACAVVLSLPCAVLFRALIKRGLRRRTLRAAWFCWQGLRRTFGLKILPTKARTRVTCRVPLEIWLEDEDTTLRWALRHDKARVLLKERVEESVEVAGQVEPSGALCWRDEGFALDLFAVPDLFERALLPVLEFRDLKSNQRLALPVKLPPGLTPEDLPRLEQEAFRLDSRDVAQVTGQLLKLASALNIPRSAAVEKLLRHQSG